MKIFHGSLEIVEHPKILLPNRKLDYGEGFYATTSEKQAEEWVKRRMFEQHAGVGYINVYEFDDTAMSVLKTLIFPKPSKEWFNFVMANRTKRGFTHDYDIVYGPVANDKVFMQFGLYEAGVIGVNTLIQELKTYKLVDQYLFHTEKSLAVLHFIDSKLITK